MKTMEVEAPRTVENEEPRRFHSHFCNPFGNCDAIGWASCCAATWFPCCIFGMNVTRVTGRIGSGIAWGVMMFVAYVLLEIGYFATRPWTSYYFNDYEKEDLECDQYFACHGAHPAWWWYVVHITGFGLIVSLGLINRWRMRADLHVKYDVEGGVAETCDDLCAWCCNPCGLCQETRTLWMHNVYDGEWYGKMAPDTPV